MIVCGLIFRCTLNHRRVGTALANPEQRTSLPISHPPKKRASRSPLVPFALACRGPIEPQHRFRCKGLINPAIVALPRLDAAASHTEKKKTFREKACASDAIPIPSHRNYE